MKTLKRCAVIILCVFSILSICKYGCNFLLNYGYVPFTKEYDYRMYIERYNENKEAFNILIHEISEYIDTMPVDLIDEGDKIRFERCNSKWNICILKKNEHLFEQEATIQQTNSIEQIEGVFDEALIGITYVKDDESYIFNIGEYYRIFIINGKVTVK